MSYLVLMETAEEKHANTSATKTALIEADRAGEVRKEWVCGGKVNSCNYSFGGLLVPALLQHNLGC